MKFSDGTKFDATAAAENILRFKKGTAAQASNLANVADAKAIDPTTLQLTLSQPDPALLFNLSQAPGLMESPKAFTSKDDRDRPGRLGSVHHGHRGHGGSDRSTSSRPTRTTGPRASSTTRSSRSWC